MMSLMKSKKPQVMRMTQPKLTDIIPYRRHNWIFGFVKTTLSGAFISIGVVLITNGLTEKPLTIHGMELPVTTGVIFILLALWIIISIDKWSEKQKKAELETIDEKIEEESKINYEELDHLSRKIAKELIEEELEKIHQQNTHHPYSDED